LKSSSFAFFNIPSDSLGGVGMNSRASGFVSFAFASIVEKSVSFG